MIRARESFFAELFYFSFSLFRVICCIYFSSSGVSTPISRIFEYNTVLKWVWCFKLKTRRKEKVTWDPKQVETDESGKTAFPVFIINQVAHICNDKDNSAKVFASRKPYMKASNISTIIMTPRFLFRNLFLLQTNVSSFNPLSSLHQTTSMSLHIYCLSNIAFYALRRSINKINVSILDLLPASRFSYIC